MPIKIPDSLPAAETLLKEGVAVMRDSDAIRQDIRPLQIALLNLMPNKIRTETQIARLIGASPLQVELTLVRVGGHQPKNTSAEHLISFYQTWEEIRERKFDGFIVTGAPVEQMPFEEVTYWDELRQIFDWTGTHVHSPFYICWGAMAAAYHFHGLPKYQLAEKAFGVFRQRNLAPASPYLSGFSDDFLIPVSRWTEVKREDVLARPSLDLLVDCEKTGPCLLQDAGRRSLFMFNHVEYDSFSLKEEFERDRAQNIPITVPHNYFPGDDPSRPPLNRWRSHAHLLFGNWINQVYQSTPYLIEEIGTASRLP
ncbi:homoserine O-succinyltransferase [Hyphomonas sp.]|uniref:homoserine O-acetyltransferase MetA n=1 Tax=Hyphomonas sp. TaxID=87 RepID=UPI0025B9CC14|nr:homoserine O-succinyltransferase [Hyphomonas sp.]MBI1400739.1 homoserine O-succinyltransferase [Hyphomonas sp.]